MRILMVNWAPLRSGANFGGGANGYVHDLAIALQERGHEIASLSGGLVHVPDNNGQQGRCEIRRVEDHHRIPCFEVVNSPVLAWSMHQFRHPKPEISSPELEAEFSRFIRLWKPDLVHFHNIEAFTSMCPGIVRLPFEDWPGAPVVFSLHNYHTVCPQVNFMHGGTSPCSNFENGNRCANCYDAPHTHLVLAERLRDSARAARREDVFAPVRLNGLVSRLTWKAPPEIPLPADPVETQDDILPRSLDATAPAPEPLSFRIPVVGNPLTNDIVPEPESTLAPNDYALRRRAMVGMLTSCTRVLPVSDFVKSKFASLGVPADRMRTILIGSRMPEVVERFGAIDEPAPLSVVDGPAGPSLSRPLRLAFLGYHNFYKGLHVVCAALELLPDATRGLIDLAVHAKDVAPILPWLRHLSRSMSRVVVEDGYRYDDVPCILRGVDLGLVPSVWWDNGPQTVMEFLGCKVPVLASEVGGIPDFIQHGVNGLLVPGNDPRRLADEILRVISEPTLLTSLRAGITPPKNMRSHAAEIEAQYAECLDSSPDTLTR